MSDEKSILHDQINYYRARAPEYDQWFFRQGRYDKGEAHRKAWEGEVKEVFRALEEAEPTGDILEFACGTGLWTQHLAARAQSVTALDAAPEVLEISRERVASKKVEYVQTDLFEWEPPRLYDFVFFGFWLTHVPHERFDSFWQLVEKALKPGGRVFFLDNSGYSASSSAVDHDPPDSSGVQERVLNDGRTFEIVKVFYEADALRARLEKLGWRGYVRTTCEFFLYGCLDRD